MAEGYTPEEDYTQDGYERDEDENIEMKDRDDWEQTKDGFVKPPEETTFDDLPEAPGTIESPALKEKIESFYKYLHDNGFNVNKNAPLEHKATFTISADRKLGINYKDETIWISHKKDTSQFLTPKTMASQYGRGGTQFVRDVLGIRNWDSPYTMPPKAEASLAKASKTIASTKSRPELEESIEMQTVEQVEVDIKNFLETSTQTELALGPPGSLPFRELAGFDRSLRNMRTTVLKMTSDREAKKLQVKKLKDEISKVSYDDGEVQFSENLQEKTEKIKTLEEEIEVLDSEIREYDGKFRSQFQRIKQTIDKMLHQDLTLGEQIQTLFREQGITIASVITALGLAIGMIVQGILSTAKSIVNPTPSPKPTPKPDPTPKPKQNQNQNQLPSPE